MDNLTVKKLGSGGVTWTLFDSKNLPNQCLLDFAINGQKNVQLREYCRAAAAEPIGRRNHKTEFQFSVLQFFGSVALAQMGEMVIQPILDDDEQVLTLKAASNGASFTRYCKGTTQAVRAFQNGEGPLGFAVQFDYQFVGGIIVATLPT